MSEPGWVRQLTLAADQFIVSRPGAKEDGATVMAGYPWFGDWGRDTMIALPGLTLHTGRPDVAARILRTFGAYRLNSSAAAEVIGYTVLDPSINICPLNPFSSSALAG